MAKKKTAFAAMQPSYQRALVALNRRDNKSNFTVLQGLGFSGELKPIPDCDGLTTVIAEILVNLDDGTAEISRVYNYDDSEMVFLACQVGDDLTTEFTDAFGDLLSDWYAERTDITDDQRNFIREQITNRLTLMHDKNANWTNAALFIGDTISFGNLREGLSILNEVPFDNSLVTFSVIKESETTNDHFPARDLFPVSWNTFFKAKPKMMEIDNYVLPAGMNFVTDVLLRGFIGQTDIKAVRNFILGFVGDSGNGKSYSAKYIAKHMTNISGTEFGYTKVNVPNIQRPNEFFARRGIEGGNTVDEYTPLYHALTQDNQVILWDEVNRVAPEILNVLLGLTDGSEHFSFNSKIHKLGKNIIHIFAFNEGYQYTGTYTMDRALISRINARVDFAMPSDDTLVKIAFKHFPEAQEKDIKAVIWFVKALGDMQNANQIQNIDVSIRAILNIIANYKYTGYANEGDNMENILNHCVLHNADPISKPEVLTLIKNTISRFSYM